METFFISHGSPMLLIDESLEVRQFFKAWREQVFSQRPSSILVISAHWETQVPTVNLVDHLNDTVYDFHGYPEQLYKLKYPAPGAPELAKRIKELLKVSGFEYINEEKERGLDHGAWCPLMLMYPEADIPVCQLSIQPEKDGTYHYNIGKALAPLKDEGVLIVCSGSATHNLSVSIDDIEVASWALEFDNWLKHALLLGRYEDVNHYEVKAPHAKMAHPWPDHFYPLHVAMGAAGQNAKAEQVHQSWQEGSLSCASYRFTAAS